MKKITTLLVLLLAANVSLMAQSNSSAYRSSARSADTVLLSTTTQGDYTVRDMLVKQTNSTGDEFSLKYKINVAELNAAYGKNSSTLHGLEAFITSVQDDPLKKITRYKVTGYASPDGNMTINEKLAMERATLFREYLDKNFDMESYPAMIDAIAEPWYATAPLVNSMAVPHKSRVLSIVGSNNSASSIEGDLKAIPSSWNYLASNVLPTMRVVELEIMYNSWKEVEVYTQNYTPTEIIITEVADNRRFGGSERYIDDGATGLVFMSDTPLDFEEKWRMRERGGFAKLNTKFRVR